MGSKQQQAMPQAEEEWLENAWQEHTWGMLVTATEHEPACPQVGKKANGIMACISYSITKGIRVVIVLCVSGEILSLSATAWKEIAARQGCSLFPSNKL